MHLARHPRVRLAHLPTPLEPMDRLTESLGGPRLWVKRDDCTGLATGGNKTRKLEFLLAEALEQGADTVLTQGAVQSNHVRQTAAGAARLGLKCEILLEERVSDPDADYRESGNVLLDRLFGARIESRPAGSDMSAELDAAAERVRRGGGRPYAIPGGGSNPTGALGYADAAMELVRQADALGLRIDHLVHATGSTGTQAGLLVGLEGTRSGIPVLGVSVRAPREAQEENVFGLAERTAARAGAPGCVRRERVVANSDYVGAGYGSPTPGMLEAVELLARTEGILLDPVYSGKAMAGLVDLVRRGFFEKGQNVVFLHTGGSAALFAYRRALAGEAPP